MRINSVICDRCRADMKNDAIRDVNDYLGVMTLLNTMLLRSADGELDLCTNCFSELSKCVKDAFDNRSRF